MSYNLIYTGIGSRETPEAFCKVMSKLAHVLSDRGFTLRSGNARGADYAFYSGAISAGGAMEIYIPEPNFGVVKGQDEKIFLSSISPQAFKIAKTHHPKWSALTDFGKRLMARNVLQILGQNLETPSDFVVCYTSDGLASGGTGQAIRIAEEHNIPIFNLHNKEDYLSLKPYFS